MDRVNDFDLILKIVHGPKKGFHSCSHYYLHIILKHLLMYFLSCRTDTKKKGFQLLSRLIFLPLSSMFLKMTVFGTKVVVTHITKNRIILSLITAASARWRHIHWLLLAFDRNNVFLNSIDSRMCSEPFLCPYPAIIPEKL